MADASATYTLRWKGNFTAKANEAAAAATTLAASMKQLEAASSTASKAVASVKPVKPLVPKPKEPEDFRKRIEPLTKALRTLGVDISPAVEGSGALGAAMKTPAFAAVAATAAIVVLVAAVVAGVAAFANYALGAADAARSTRLLAEAATGGAKAGGVLLYQAAQLARVTGLTEQQLQQMGLGLSRNGLAGQRLADVFETVAIASSAMGDAAGSKIASIAEEAQKTRRIVLNMFNLQGTGVTIDEVAKALAARAKVPFAVAKGALQDGRVKVDAALDALNRAVKAKLGAIAEKQALALPKQLEQAGKNISKLFDAVNVDPALDGLKLVLSIFDQNTVAGKALAKILTVIAQPLIDGFGKAAPIIAMFFLGMIIGAQEFIIVCLKVRNAIRRAFGDVDLGNFDAMEAALTAGKVAAIAFAIAVGTVAVSLALAGAIAAAPFLILYGIFKLIEIAVTSVIDAFGRVGAVLSGIDWAGIGTNLVRGLVNGITSGVGWVIDAVKGLGKAATDTLRKVLTIQSPSVVFRDLGQMTALGFAKGVDAGAANDVEPSVAAMVKTPEAAGAAGLGSTTIVRRIDKVEINIHGVTDAQQFRQSGVLDELVRALEGVLNETGGPLSAPEAA